MQIFSFGPIIKILYSRKNNLILLDFQKNQFSELNLK